MISLITLNPDFCYRSVSWWSRESPLGFNNLHDKAFKYRISLLYTKSENITTFIVNKKAKSIN